MLVSLYSPILLWTIIPDTINVKPMIVEEDMVSPTVKRMKRREIKGTTYIRLLIYAVFFDRLVP